MTRALDQSSTSFSLLPSRCAAVHRGGYIYKKNKQHKHKHKAGSAPPVPKPTPPRADGHIGAQRIVTNPTLPASVTQGRASVVDAGSNSPAAHVYKVAPFDASVEFNKLDMNAAPVTDLPTSPVKALAYANRYHNVLPNKHSRVHLQQAGVRAFGSTLSGSHCVVWYRCNESERSGRH